MEINQQTRRLGLPRQAKSKLLGQTNMSNFGNLKKKVNNVQQRKAFGLVSNQNLNQKQHLGGGDKKQLKGKEVLKKTSTFKKVTQVEKIQEVIHNDVSMATESEDELDVSETESLELDEVTEIFAEVPAGVTDIDQLPEPQLAPVYAKDIYQFKMFLEHELSVPKHFLEDKSLSYKLRTRLVDWLVQVNHRFQLMQETLYTTVDILDRYLAVADDVEKKNLQLVGVTAMHIASKFEEMYAPEISDYVFVSDNSLTKDEVIQMEMKILKKLAFRLGKPNCLHFLRRNSKAGNVEPKHHFLAKYLMELSLVDYHLSHVTPSRIGASALCLSLMLHDGDDTWTPTLEFYSTYNKDALMPVIRRMCKNLSNATQSQEETMKFIHSKYSHKKLMKIAKHECIVENIHMIRGIAEEYTYEDL